MPRGGVESDSGILACPVHPARPGCAPACPACLTFAGEVLDGHVLDGNLLEEEWLLAPGVPTDDPPLPQPLAEPGQVAVAVEGIGQEVSGRREQAFSGCLCLYRGSWARSCSAPWGPVLQRVRPRSCSVPWGPALQRVRPRGKGRRSGKGNADTSESRCNLCKCHSGPWLMAMTRAPGMHVLSAEP